MAKKKNTYLEDEMGILNTRCRLAISTCNKIKGDVPEAAEWKWILLSLEKQIHTEWAKLAK